MNELHLNVRIGEHFYVCNWPKMVHVEIFRSFFNPFIVYYTRIYWSEINVNMNQSRKCLSALSISSHWKTPFLILEYNWNGINCCILLFFKECKIINWYRLLSLFKFSLHYFIRRFYTNLYFRNHKWNGLKFHVGMWPVPVDFICTCIRVFNDMDCSAV